MRLNLLQEIGLKEPANTLGDLFTATILACHLECLCTLKRFEGLFRPSMSALSSRKDFQDWY